ncbi:MAG: hypothetical protein WCK35_08080 [Chloroflexota bacterium]
MDNKESLRDRVQKEARQSKTGFAHSKAYHRFFEGYSEIKVPNQNGKGYRIQRIYTADYHRQDLTKAQQLVVRILYVVLFITSAYLFISSAALPLSSNSTWYVVMIQVISTPLLFWILVTLFSYLPAGQDLTIAEYRSSSLALQKATLSAAISLGLAALVTLVFMSLNQSNEPLSQLLCAVKYFGAGLLVLTMNRVEKKINYLVIPSHNKLPVDEGAEKQAHPSISEQ